MALWNRTQNKHTNIQRSMWFIWFIWFSCSMLFHCTSWTIIILEREAQHTHTRNEWAIEAQNCACFRCFAFICCCCWSSFVIVIIFHSFVFVFPIIFVDASFVELLGSWELIYRFVVGSRNTVCVQCLRGECIECSVLLYFAWHSSNK